jgi:hypothetical protein
MATEDGSVTAYALLWECCKAKVRRRNSCQKRTFGRCTGAPHKSLAGKTGDELRNRRRIWKTIEVRRWSLLLQTAWIFAACFPFAPWMGSKSTL